MRIRRTSTPVKLGIWALLAVTAFWPAPALAGDTAHAKEAPASEPVDTVHLLNGHQHRGRVTEVVPGDHVTIIDERSTKVFPWSQVDRIVVETMSPPPASTPQEAPPTTTSSSPPAAPSSPPPPLEGPLAHVRLVTPKPVVLYRRPAGTSSWVLVCNTPCTADLPIGDAYRVMGNGVRPSAEFRLGAREGEDVTVSVDPPSSAGAVLGALLAAIGGVTAYAGLANAAGGNNRTSPGLATLAIGSGLFVGGIAIHLAARSTDVTVSRGSKAGAAAATRPLDAFLREPLGWRRAEHDTRATFPLVFEGRF
jgi:hypothetical protein